MHCNIPSVIAFLEICRNYFTMQLPPFRTNAKPVLNFNKLNRKIKINKIIARKSWAINK